MGKNRGDVYLRGAVYWCWVKTAEGKWERKSTGRRDKIAARLEKKRLERQYADPDHHAANQATVENAIKNLIAFKKNQGRAAGTIRMYREKGGHLMRIFGVDCRLGDITAARVDDYIATRLSETATKHTVHKELVTLRGALKVAKRRKEFPGDIFSIMPVGFSPEYEPRKTYLTWGQLRKLLDELKPRRAAHVAFVLATGSRRIEAVRAKRSDVEGKFLKLRGSKTAASKRTIPVIELFEALLEQALADAPGDGRGALFDPWINARRDILRACERVRETGTEIPDVTWNDLRRTFGSLLRQSGVRQLDTLADLFGHSSTVMVRKVYAQDTPQSLADDVRRQLAHSTVTTQRDVDQVRNHGKNKGSEEE